jgi:TonB family protein
MRLHTLHTIAISTALLMLPHVAAAASVEPALEVPPTAPEPSAPKVEPPVLNHFVSATYPAEALAQRLTAQVVLALEIDATGKVVSAVVQEPRGHGFDEAAQKAAMAFEFVPAMKDGRPMASRILYRYDFTLKEEPLAQASPTAPAVPAMATLMGRIDMGDSKEPLGGATVRLTLSNGRVVQTVADAMGRWQVAELAPGPVSVHVEAPGFLPWDGKEKLAGGEQLDLVYRLRPPAEGLEVVVRGERQDREVTRRTIEREQLAVIPGTGGDALRAIETMPGAGRAPAYSGMIISRGSSPNGTQMLVDGLFTPQIYHFGGLTSIIPTEMIEAIDFFPGNFSAKYGRASGGIVDVRLRDMKNDGKYHGLAQIDVIDARLLLQGPVPLLKGWNFLIAGRRSHLDAWLAPLMEKSVGVRTAPVYYDWQGFLETRPTAKSYLRFGVFGSDDRLALVMKDADSADPGFGNSFSSRSGISHAQALYRHEYSEDLSWSLTASIGKDFERFAFGSMMIDLKYRPINLRGDLTYKLRKNLTVRVGPDMVYYHIDANLRTPQPPLEGEPEPGPYSVQPMLTYKDSLNLFGPAGYAEIEWLPTSRLKFLFGNRVDYYNLLHRVNYSPRFNARYDVVQGSKRTTIKVGAGRFYENPQIIELVDIYGSPGIHANRSEHYAIGAEQVFTDNIDLSVEGFYKDLSDWSVPVAKADGSRGYANIGEGKVVGLEVLLRYKPTDRFFGWVAYTLSRSTRTDAPGEAERVFEYDQTHNLSLLASYKLGRGWQLGGRFRYVTGNPYTPCVGGIVQAGAGTYTCRSGDTYSARMPAFHQLDMRVDKTWTFQSWKLTGYLDVQNAYNRSNPMGMSYNYNYTKPKYAGGLPIIPSLGVRGEF